jgi:hypothetical protein
MDAGEQRIAVCTSRPLGEPAPGVERLVVVVHGNSRNADDYLRYVTDAAQEAGAEDTTLVLAPQFPTEDDVEDEDGDGVAVWTSDGWKEGDDSTTSPALSSFAAVDAVIAEVAGEAAFPDLREVVVAGHSAGGQFVQRYAAGTAIGDRIGPRVRFVVANPSSYLWFTRSRPESAREACPGYDDYKYGTRELNAHLAEVGPAGLRRRYTGHRVSLLLGEDDDDPGHSSLDTRCEAQRQGASRLERGRNFFAHARALRARTTLTIVHGIGHDGQEMFASPEGRRTLFAPLPAERPAPAGSDGDAAPLPPLPDPSVLVAVTPDLVEALVAALPPTR